MFGEGLAEEIFLKHLRSLYARNRGVAVTIRNGKGGDAVSIVVNATNEPGDFNRRVVILDNDKSEEEMKRAHEEAQQRNVELLENNPCLEAVLLSILRPGQDFSNKSSAWCKKEFESNYMDKSKRSDVGEYEKVFPRQTLDDRRRDISALNVLIVLMGN